MREKMKRLHAWMGRGWAKVAGQPDDRNLLGVVGDFTVSVVATPFEFTWWLGKTIKTLAVDPKKGGEELGFQGFRFYTAIKAGMGISMGPYGPRVSERVQFLGWGFLGSIILAPFGVLFGPSVPAIMMIWAPATWIITGIRPFVKTWRLVQREQYMAAKQVVELKTVKENLEDLAAAPERMEKLRLQIQDTAPAARRALTDMKSGAFSHKANETKAIGADVHSVDAVIGKQIEDLRASQTAFVCPENKALAMAWLDLHEEMVGYPFVIKDGPPSKNNMVTFQKVADLRGVVGEKIFHEIFSAYKAVHSARHASFAQAAHISFNLKHGGEIIIDV